MLEFINQMPLAGLMLVTALGFTLGRLEFRGMSLGPAGGTLFTALMLGYYYRGTEVIGHAEFRLGAVCFHSSI